MITKILAAYDASESSERAYDFALDLAGKYSAQIIVLSVSSPPEPPIDVEPFSVPQEASEYYEKHFSELKQRAAARGIEATFEIRQGHPADQIVRTADEKGVDMIVMGHRGKSLVEHWLLGSVSKRVLSYAHCTVVIVR